MGEQHFAATVILIWVRGMIAFLDILPILVGREGRVAKGVFIAAGIATIGLAVTITAPAAQGLAWLFDIDLYNRMVVSLLLLALLSLVLLLLLLLRSRIEGAPTCRIGSI